MAYYTPYIIATWNAAHKACHVPSWFPSLCPMVLSFQRKQNKLFSKQRAVGINTLGDLLRLGGGRLNNVRVKTCTIHIENPYKFRWGSPHSIEMCKIHGGKEYVTEKKLFCNVWTTYSSARRLQASCTLGYSPLEAMLIRSKSVFCQIPDESGGIQSYSRGLMHVCGSPVIALYKTEL